MKNIIWNKDELKEIKKIILIRANLKVNEENELVTSNKYALYDSCGYTDKTMYHNVSNELEGLLYIPERESIYNLLVKASKLKESNNKNYGFITTISKVNPENHYEIFIIFKELIAQYEHFSYMVAKKAVDNYNNMDDARKRVKEIITSTEETNEEILVKLLIEKVFTGLNDIVNDDLFRPLINKLNNMIKLRLIQHFNYAIASKGKQEYIQKRNDKYDYLNKVKKRIVR